MLLKNNLRHFLLILFVLFSFCSCTGGGTYEAGECIYLCVSVYNKDDVESDIIQTNRIKLNGTEYISLKNVACSLRNDSVSKGEILAYGKTDSSGDITFCFSTNQEKCIKFSSMYYLSDAELEDELEAQQAGTSNFYIIINDPELSGYDEKYETVRRPATRDINNTTDIVSLGKK